MTNKTVVVDWTADGVQFAPWLTPVQDDDLQLISLNYASTDFVGYGSEGFTLRLPPELSIAELGVLTASFFSKQRLAIVSFKFQDVNAFRVLDEGGLLELWAASKSIPRPAQTTFRVRGHAWQKESVLAWVHGTGEDHYSLMIATEWECLEVIAHQEPEIHIRSAQVDYDRKPS